MTGDSNEEYELTVLVADDEDNLDPSAGDDVGGFEGVLANKPDVPYQSLLKM